MRLITNPIILQYVLLQEDFILSKLKDKLKYYIGN